jgi:hypothetical protein
MAIGHTKLGHGGPRRNFRKFMTTPCHTPMGMAGHMAEKTDSCDGKEEEVNK